MKLMLKFNWISFAEIGKGGGWLRSVIQYRSNQFTKLFGENDVKYAVNLK